MQDDLAWTGAVLNGPRLTLEAVEQALCEWQKYLRVENAGLAKRTYRPAAVEDLSPWNDLPERFTNPTQWVSATLPRVRTPLQRPMPGPIRTAMVRPSS
jgi:hypothetical protein